ncbi:MULTISPECIES: hypothetical protein [unclassified Lysinibacillus]|uniref:hypothetical protein n=1 Tax=unclassified Lysinibacillus TaxID=2636778 RepID=UPI00131F13AC|nr:MULTISPECIES: hypothetical protein [unclassified Lysinibacillus]
MPLPQIRLVFCDACGKLIKSEKFGDALTPMEWKRMQNMQKKHLCGKCKVKIRLTKLLK